MYFPQELVDLIIGYSEDDLQTLVAFCLVSSACFHTARPLLYRKVDFISSQDPNALVLGKVLFNAISSDHQLASYVREFTLDAELYLHGLDSLQDAPSPLDVLRQTLNSMTRLKKLRIVLPDKCDDEFPIDPTLLQHPFQLEELYWRDFRWYVHVKPQLDKLLALQPRLRTLEMVFGPDAAPTTFTIAPTACPDLETFSGNFEHYRLLAPARPITSFICSGITPIPSSVLDSIAPALSKLRILVIHEGFPRELDFAVLTSHLTSLEVLHLSLEDTRATIQSYHQIRSGQRIVEHVHKLTKLRTFVLCVEPLEMQLHEHAQRMLTAQWFDTLPHFERAYFNGSIKGSGDLVCWARDDVQRPRTSGMEEVFEMYDARHAFETSLLKPFFNNSRPAQCAPDPPADKPEISGTCHCRFGKRFCPPSGEGRTPRWKRVFWDTVTHVSGC
ncbi:hypothetical protein P691DRAFT_781582 [Macrolepiota fuliginosa MF-IS2]|uniref:Uncharacterized protein n=1 Tax=Macrolepiota fuliginosa MF-IS2 TaxID=1400762 RepID=A0A9P5XEX9_9AGAR|nr:hypothetical protein P691DRAFT_781582 [Macrolepiota fuliginosa MF-IS2]